MTKPSSGRNSGTTSLAFRLTAIAVVWAVLGLVAGGYLLSQLFRQSVERTFDRRLEADIDALIAGHEKNAALKVVSVEPPSDPRYGNVFSGWYWQISPLESKDGRLVLAKVEPPAPPAQSDAGKVDDSDGLLTSSSLWDERLAVPLGLAAPSEARGSTQGPQKQSLRYVVRVRILEGERSATAPAVKAKGTVYAFMVAGDTKEIEADITGFNRTLIWSIAIMGLGLLAAVIVQVRLGLAPLRRVGEALAAIREGKAQKLEGEFPVEINPLARELNALVEHNAEVVQRARTHVGNLAHFLKTPLSVLTNEASVEKTPLAEAVMRQTQIMRRQVDHYLSRARAAGSSLIIGSRTEAAPVIQDLARTLEKIYADRGVEIEVAVDASLSFRGERQDLEEMVGNLLDNACKWAKSAARIVLKPGEQGELLILVGDDGPGLTLEQRGKVMNRGERLDESKPGSGLGLSIVREIAGLYGGKVELGESELGGLEARLTLPGA
jgi:signal transduction histidine kinase